MCSEFSIRSREAPSAARNRRVERARPAGSGQGFHHIGIWTENFDQDLADLNGLGYETINAGRTRSTDFAYVDARPLLGCMLEIVTKTPLAERRFSEIATAAEDWQGDAPLRYA